MQPNEQDIWLNKSQKQFSRVAPSFPRELDAGDDDYLEISKDTW